MKTTAYKDVHGNLHESKKQWEIVNLKHELQLEVEDELLKEQTKFIIEQGKKAQRLLKLL
jgi:hypothetical protein